MSNETNWTPGPWRVINNGPHWNNQRITNWEIAYSQDGELVAEHVYAEADAYLMAAAPELFDALDGLLSELDSTPEIDLSSWGVSTAKARAALTKARGEQS